MISFPSPERCHPRRPRTCQPCGWWRRAGSNRRPPACKAGALPTELRPLGVSSRCKDPRIATSRRWQALHPGRDLSRGRLEQPRALRCKRVNLQAYSTAPPCKSLPQQSPGAPSASSASNSRSRRCTLVPCCCSPVSASCGRWSAAYSHIEQMVGHHPPRRPRPTTTDAIYHNGRTTPL